VQFLDARIEYEDREGRLRTEDLQVETLHYRGGHAAAKASSGFTRCSAGMMRVVRSRGSGGGAGGRGRPYGLGITASTGKSGGRGLDPRLAEEVFRVENLDAASTHAARMSASLPGFDDFEGTRVVNPFA
jgi:hypothetical protein